MYLWLEKKSVSWLISKVPYPVGFAQREYLHIHFRQVFCDHYYQSLNLKKKKKNLCISSTKSLFYFITISILFTSFEYSFSSNSHYLRERILILVKIEANKYMCRSMGTHTHTHRSSSWLTTVYLSCIYLIQLISLPTYFWQSCSHAHISVV